LSGLPSIDEVIEIIARGGESVHPISNDATSYFCVLEHPTRIGIRLAWDGEIPQNLDQFRYIQFEVRTWAGKAWLELTLDATSRLEEAYAVLELIARKLPGPPTRLMATVFDTLSAFAEVFDELDAPAIQSEIGLWGELHILSHIIKTVGDSAIDCWHGPDNEEHDFALSTLDLEVKTTSSERRLHWFGAPTQLVSSPGRQLVLVSVQLTPASPTSGKSAPEIAEDISKVLSKSQAHLFFGKLDSIAWYQRLLVTGPHRWQIRSACAVLEVSDDFPGLTPARIAGATTDVLRLASVQQQIDVTNMAVMAPLPKALEGLNGNVTA
jgi:hypothetical protein